MTRCVTLWVGLVLVWVAAVGAPSAAAARVVRIKLVDGALVEGVLVSEDETQVVIEEERAGGTIRQQRTIRRPDIAELIEFSAAELAQRAQQQAYAEVQRYRLDPTRSYEASNYARVIDGVFRPFLERYPDAPQTAEVRQRLDEWQTEYDRVRTGHVKYQGTWMEAAAAVRLYAGENTELVMRQAQALINQKQYAKAIDRLEPLDTPAARQLKADAYRQWVSTLETEQQQAAQRVQTAQDRVNRIPPPASVSAPVRSPLGTAKEVAKDQSYQRLGEQGKDVVAYNQARADLAAAQQELQQAQARLTAVERELARVRPLAAAAGTVATAPGATGPVAGGPAGGSPFYVSVPAEKEDWSNPSLLQNMWRFIQRYWVAGAVVVVLGLWLLSRKLAK